MQTITEVSESDASTTYPVTDILWSGQTAACGTVTFAESPVYGRMLFLDGEIQSTSSDEHIYHESLVHPVMTSTFALKQRGLEVLVVGGGEGATVREVLKWPVAYIDWVDIDGELVELCKKHLGWGVDLDDPDNGHVNYYAQDIQAYLAGLDPLIQSYDVIILDLPDPDGETGYLYSPEFWHDIKKFLNYNGALVTHVGPVRAFGDGGAGVRRVAESVRAAGMTFDPAGLYHVGIPSFQGDWGFWIWRATDLPPWALGTLSVDLPEGLTVVDKEQLRQWMTPPLSWRRIRNGI